MKKPFVIGLTGSIGMGKTTTAKMFAEKGIPVWSADEAVHRIYRSGGPAENAIARISPSAVGDAGVDRAELSEWLAGRPERLAQLEEIVHPLVREDRRRFLENVDSEIVLLDIPLLFETGADAGVDTVVVVTTSPEEQHRRVLARQGMSEEKLKVILGNQMPDSEKRARADHIIETATLDDANAAVQKVINEIKDHLAHA